MKAKDRFIINSRHEFIEFITKDKDFGKGHYLVDTTETRLYPITECIGMGKSIKAKTGMRIKITKSPYKIDGINLINFIIENEENLGEFYAYVGQLSKTTKVI